MSESTNQFVLNEETYYSQEANKRYMSVHQYLDFAGGFLLKGCEARAMAQLNGEWTQETTKAMLIGNFVDCAFEGTLNKFKKTHPEIFTKTSIKKYPDDMSKWELLSDYKMAEKMIKRCEEDELFMRYMSGEKQTIMTGYLFGCDWKIKMDSYIPDVAIIDLKTTSKLHEMWRIADLGYVSFVEAFDYVTQLAIYQKIVEINTGKKLPCYICAITKSDCPEPEVIYLDQQALDHALNAVEMNMPSVLAVKNGEAEPIGCGKCDYCISKKKLVAPISMYDLIEV